MIIAPLDIVGVGSVAVDDLLYVAEYPPADAKARVLRRERQCGGLTGTALVAAARSGARCGFAGVVGLDELSDVVARQFEHVGVDTAWMARDPAARVIYSVIVVEEQQRQRTIFYDLEGTIGVNPSWPPAEAIESARALYVDHVDAEMSLRAARMAQAANVAVIADFEYVSSPQFSELLDLVDHLILPVGFAAQLSGRSDPAEAALALGDARRALVAVTCGAEGAWWVEREAPSQPRHQPAFAVPVADTTGCGDVFHGAYAAALVRGLSAVARLRYAAAAAALKATRPGAQAGIPTRAEVEAFMSSQSVVEGSRKGAETQSSACTGA
ncbi:MAG TPA: PfkB family carbohydrate kinase [Roseiflexaceae bacterium]|nr:PfkB family carbohydrate kinase [Roseiflexaceae bacterium]